MGETAAMDLLCSWDDFHRAQSGLMSEAVGWGRGVDLADDAALLTWAREYLPRMLALQGQAPS